MWTVEKATPGLNGHDPRPRNLLLQALPRRDYERLSPSLERVVLTPRRVLQHAQIAIHHLYFIEEGLVSVLANTGERSTVEVWLIGREGLVGCPALLGAGGSPLRYFVQVGVSALRIGVDDLRQAMAEMPELRAVLHDYLHCALMQSTQSAACSLRHSLLQRLARWLLAAQDRTGRNDIPITQDLLARSLGVRRASVSEAFKPLERRGIFARQRGLIRILNRARLEELACRCYRVMRPKLDDPEQPDAAQRGNGRGPLMALPFICALLEVQLVVQ
jgi:CRP-like cAMP-binding protein